MPRVRVGSSVCVPVSKTQAEPHARERTQTLAAAGACGRCGGWVPNPHQHGRENRRDYGVAVPLRILLADDQQMIREALAMILDLEIDLEVVKQVGRGDEVLPAVRETRPDVALLDIEMPGATGIEAAAELARSGLTSQAGARFVRLF